MAKADFSLKYRSGYALLVMMLLIFVVGGLVWLDPGALFKKKDKSLPWNQTRRIIPPNKPVLSPVEDQPEFVEHMIFQGECEKNGQDRGKILIGISPQGRVRGNWTADFMHSKDLHYQVIMGGFKGNIDPKYIYKDDSGEDRSKLYIITEGKLMILETREKSGQMRKVGGWLYVTGWIDNDYYLKGKVTITSDRKNYHEYDFQGQLNETAPFSFDLLR